MDKATGKFVAIKRPVDPCKNVFAAQHCMRELALLKSFKHPNVLLAFVENFQLIRLLDVFTPQETVKDFQEIYMVTPFMKDGTLHQFRVSLKVPRSLVVSQETGERGEDFPQHTFLLRLPNPPRCQPPPLCQSRPSSLWP